jgi:hypothetical protein
MKRYLTILSVCFSLLILASVFMTGCNSKPDNATIEQVIKEYAASYTADLPDLDYTSMTVPHRWNNKADAVIMSADGKYQVNFSITYDRNKKKYTVSECFYMGPGIDQPRYPIVSN